MTRDEHPDYRASLVTTAPELAAPPDQCLPHFGKIVARTLEAGERATVRYWSNRTELAFVCKLDTPGLRLDSHTLRVESPDGYRIVPWRAVYMVQGAIDRYIDPRRLCLLPWQLAREESALLEIGSLDRSQWELRDSFRRAFARGRLFAGGEYAPSFVAQLESRPQPAPDPRDAEPHQLPHPAWQDRVGQRRTAGDHPDYAATLDQLGMRQRVDGTYTHTGHPAGPMRHGPERPQGPGVGDIDYWADRLRRFDDSPGYVNGVPVRRIPCVPPRFEVTLYELTGEAGMGCGARQRITRVCTLLEAAELVQRGECKHYKYSRGADRWSEVG